MNEKHISLIDNLHTITMVKKYSVNACNIQLQGTWMLILQSVKEEIRYTISIKEDWKDRKNRGVIISSLESYINHLKCSEARFKHEFHKSN